VPIIRVGRSESNSFNLDPRPGPTHRRSMENLEDSETSPRTERVQVGSDVPRRLVLVAGPWLHESRLGSPSGVGVRTWGGCARGRKRAAGGPRCRVRPSPADAPPGDRLRAAQPIAVRQAQRDLEVFP
jgi:hypothetical protein